MDHSRLLTSFFTLYLGGNISQIAKVDNEAMAGISKASGSFIHIQHSLSNFFLLEIMERTYIQIDLHEGYYFFGLVMHQNQ